MSINKNAVEVLCGEFSFNLRGEFESKVVEITPETATKLLSFSEGNRNLKTSSLSILVQAIKENDFVVTNNAISFDENFILRDGHHRLKAISIAGKTVNHAVSINIPFQNFQHVDRGVTRSQSDILSIYATHKFDFSITPTEVSSARFLMQLDKRNRARVCHKEIESVINANKSGFKFVSCNYTNKNKGTCTAAIRAALICASDYVSHEKLELFCLMLSQGVSSGIRSESNAALFCRDALIGHKFKETLVRYGFLGNTNRNVSSIIEFNFVQHCIQQFIAGKDVNRVVTGATMDKETKEITLSPIIYAPISVI